MNRILVLATAVAVSFLVLSFGIAHADTIGSGLQALFYSNRAPVAASYHCVVTCDNTKQELKCNTSTVKRRVLAYRNLDTSTSSKIGNTNINPASDTTYELFSPGAYTALNVTGAYHVFCKLSSSTVAMGVSEYQ
jgi:hypothetical protein